MINKIQLKNKEPCRTSISRINKINTERKVFKVEPRLKINTYRLHDTLFKIIKDKIVSTAVLK